MKTQNVFIENIIRNFTNICLTNNYWIIWRTQRSFIAVNRSSILLKKKKRTRKEIRACCTMLIRRFSVNGIKGERVEQQRFIGRSTNSKASTDVCKWNEEELLRRNCSWLINREARNAFVASIEKSIAVVHRPCFLRAAV